MSSALNAQVSTTWSPCVFTTRTAWPAAHPGRDTAPGGDGDEILV